MIRFKINLSGILVKAFLLTIFCNLNLIVAENNEKDWWETASFYQIYPRSFKDSNGDGIGDLNGVTSSLAYLKEIGVNATWLSPIFKSPMKDFGYDISDFYDIQPEYGTLEDFDNLVKEAKRLGIKVILDFVPNHSSDECEWFKKSVLRDEIYKDYYVWHPGYPDPNNSSNRLPPSNWISVFRKSAWTWNEQRQEFFLHQFLEQQPDLNYRNPLVVNEMKDVLRFWMSHGADGFRIDAVPHLFEIDKNSEDKYLDEPRSFDANAGPDDWPYLKHIYTLDQPEAFDMVFQWREVTDQFKSSQGGETRVILAEVSSAIDIVMKYYGTDKRNGAHMPFNFVLLSKVNNQSTAYDIKNAMDFWMNQMPSGRTPNWVMGNHDSGRVGTRFGQQRIDLMNILIMTLPGASVTYNGEEIGMTNVHISWKDTIDSAACNSDPENYEKYSRDPSRTPFQWDDTKNSGFSTGDKTWLPVAESYKAVNVKIQRDMPGSHLNIYKALQKLRQTNTLKNGGYKAWVLNENVISVLRFLRGESNYVILINFGANKENVDLYRLSKSLPDTLEYVIVSGNSPNTVGKTAITRNISLVPYEAVVLKTK